MNYLLDSNTFIEAKNRYYNMKVCPAYWDWLLRANGKSQLCSIDMVLDELVPGKDELADWANQNKHVFHPVDDEATQSNFQTIVALLPAFPNMKPGAIEDL